MAQSALAQIRKHIADVEAQLDRKEKELAELRTAERVMVQLGFVDADGNSDDVEEGGGKRKTIADRMLRLLEEFGPLESPDINRLLIREGVNAAPASVSSILSRLKGADRIALLGRHWMTKEYANSLSIRGSQNPGFEERGEKGENEPQSQEALGEPSVNDSDKTLLSYRRNEKEIT